MYTLKSIARRGTALGAIAALLTAVVIPAFPAYADSLNPLTERSLLLSSSAPGFQDTDGSGNSECNLNANGENYEPPGSAPNGKKSGQTFSFNVSTDSTGGGPAIKAMTFQYCTSAAGYCQAPGNNLGNGDVDDDGNISDSTRQSNAVAHPTGKSDLEVVYSGAVAGTDFQVFIDADDDGVFEAGEEQSTGWTMAVSRAQDKEHLGVLTDKNNYITLTNATGITPAAGERVGVKFNASSTDYITNPGAGSFFVKINTYDSDSSQINPNNDTTPNDDSDQTVIDGGVTVANMMTDSIHITTKVLETMDFSVGVRNKDTQAVAHGSCDPIEVINNNRLNLGDASAEYSLRTDTAYDTFSYWRLSSNSSGGATVYYSGNTLANTVGDEIDQIGAEANSHPGTEQFGLALIPASGDTLDGGTFPANHITPTIAPLTIDTNYDEGGFQGDNDISSATTADNAKFAFFKTSQTTPEVIAQDNDDVLPCATSKVRYVANIAADTPAGIYTTKVNYLAAPQY